MKNKILLALLGLSCVAVELPGKNPAYPSEKVAQFVVDTLDVTSLPAAFRPKKEKGKKTFADYRFTPQSVGENRTILTAPDTAKSLAINVLDQNSSGIYICLAAPAEREASKRAQAVLLLKRKDANALLKGRLTSREFSTCPVTVDDSSESSY